MEEEEEEEEDYPGHSTPLLRAIRSQHVNEVQALLKKTSNANGVSLRGLSINAAGFLRFGPINTHVQLDNPCAVFHTRENALLAIGKPQLSTITEEEVKDRYEDCIARFWTEPYLRPLDQIQQGDVIPAFVEAAQGSSIEIINLLLSASADISFWCSEPTALPTNPTASSLAVSTPLHSAVWSRNADMLRHLLAKGLNPNTMPLAAPTRCITPAMATIVHCDPWNQEAYEVLRHHPKFNPYARTPVYSVHLLHFAVATLSLPLIETISAHVPTSHAGKTALGHTLLHVACMPLDERYIQMHSEAVYRSIHETRNLSETEGVIKPEHKDLASNDYVTVRPVLDYRRWSLDEFRAKIFHSQTPPLECIHKRLMSSRHYHQAQTLAVQLICEHAPVDVGSQDVHGNTALHYLASQRGVNRDLIAWLRTRNNGEMAWRQKKNQYGYTAEDLLESAEAAVEIQDRQPFWHNPYSRYIRNEADKKRLQQTLDDMSFQKYHGIPWLTPNALAIDEFA
ncbi:MAG: hypothetical protein LQ348_004798 [Seirophora lacunosa]|nr:MAG: hypothetical protein LQ348_004798 [Seirophora lacunosa]